MKFYFVGDRGDIAGHGAVKYGDVIDVDQADGEALAIANIPVIPDVLWPAVPETAGEPGTPAQIDAARLALHDYRTELTAGLLNKAAAEEES
jgi:hypothetical protein